MEAQRRGAGAGRLDLAYITYITYITFITIGLGKKKTPSFWLGAEKRTF
jgi:hypothetical protein